MTDEARGDRAVEKNNLSRFLLISANILSVLSLFF